MATSGTSIIAAMAAKARREVREHFERERAFDRSAAVTYEPPSRMHRSQFDRLVGLGVVRPAEGGRYWLDPEAERVEEERRQAAAILVLKVAFIGLAIAVAVIAILTAGR